MQKQGAGRAVAVLRGGNGYPGVYGTAWLRQLEDGVLVTVRVFGLPTDGAACGGRCTGTGTDDFAGAGGHYNPDGCPHPFHAGDLPPLLGCHGTAYCSVMTDRFTLEQAVGKTVILHAGTDDFTTQPSGNAGTMIACGVIQYG